MPPSSHTSAPEIPGVDLVGVIGSGGSGVVYLGRQAAFGRDVAVKVASNTAAADDATRRWEREVAAIGRLSNHPNIVPVFDAGITADGSPYLVMPHVPGGTLGDRLRDEGPLDPAEVASFGAKLAGTLATVHAAGVLHRDVKPDNVLWSPHGEPQLTDFGIARLRDLTTTFGGGLEATIAYAAPEVLKGEPASEATDVYGLGATLYACLTGSSPHPSRPGEHVAALVARVVAEPPPPLAEAGTPQPLAQVIDRAMALAPQDRQASADELRRDLERAASVMAGTAAPATTQPAPVATTVFPPVEAAPDDDRTAVQERVVAPPPSRPEPDDDGRRSWGLWAAVLAVLALFVGLVAFGLSRGEDDGAGDLATDTSDTEATDDTQPAVTEPTEGNAPEGGGATDVGDDTTTTAPEQEAAGDGAADTAVTYLRTLDRGEFDQAWAMTTSRFQAQQDRSSWEGFWGGHDVEIVGDPQVDGDSVVVPLTFDGQREDYRLTVVQQGGGWLIDGPVGD